MRTTLQMRRIGVAAAAVAAVTIFSAEPYGVLAQSGHRVHISGIPSIAIPQPPGAKCAGVKISSKVPGRYVAAINCNNGFAYAFFFPQHALVKLQPFAGGVESASDIDANGYAVGTSTAGGTAFPVRWNPNGVVGVLPNPGNGTAAGVDQFGAPIVGFGAGRAVWYAPGAHFFGGGGSAASDVNSAHGLVVGQVPGLGAAAAVGPGGGGLVPMCAGCVSPNSIARAVNENNLIVGQQIFGGACGGGAVGDGFIYPWPAGPVVGFGRLAGHCTSNAEDVNNNASVVGYSSPGVPAWQHAVGLNLPPIFGAGFVDLRFVIGGANLTDAPGIDDNGDVLATDGILGKTYVLN